MAVTRRGPIEPPRLSKLANLQQVAERQEAFNREVLGIVGGLPAGFGATVLPLAIEAGATGSKGQETSGWAAANHQHPIVTGQASALSLSSTSTEGAGAGLARAGHTHDMSRVGTEVLIRVSLGF